MLSRAKVYRHPLSRFFQAWYMVWDAKLQKWKPKTTSTRCEDEAKALEIAREYERVAQAAGGMMTRLSRDYLADVMNDILRISGHRPFVDAKPWKDYAEAWLAAQLLRVPKTLSMTTYRTFRGHVNQFTSWLGKDAAAPLSAISGEMMQRWYQDILDSGLSITTANHKSTCLSSIFQRSIDEGYSTKNPVNLITRQANDCNERDPFTPAEMAAILNYLSSKPKLRDWLTVAHLGFYTSQRLSDCAGAMKSHFHPGEPFMIWDMKQAKTGKKLRIPIIPPASEHIASVLNKGSSLYLAPSLANAEGGVKNNLSLEFSAIMTAAGVVGRKIERKGRGHSFQSKTFHSTRHTCNSLLAAAGVPFEIRKLITGHGDVATNIIYTHLEDAQKGKALAKAFKPKKPA